MMNLTEGYKVKSPTRYDKKCRYCGAWVSVQWKDMNFKGPTFARCSCGHEVQFTDDWGRCPTDVSFVYEKEKN